MQVLQRLQPYLECNKYWNSTNKYSYIFDVIPPSSNGIGFDVDFDQKTNNKRLQRNSFFIRLNIRVDGTVKHVFTMGAQCSWEKFFFLLGEGETMKMLIK